MGYYECIFEASSYQREAVIAFSARLGSLGITETDAGLVAYFPDTIGIDRIRAEVSAFLGTLAKCGLPPLSTWQCTYLAERDWNETWKKRFVPIDVGDAITIIPPWEKAPPDRIPLIIDPGMAFGTGHHETTKACLEQLERLSLSMTERKAPLSLLDVGTGTGILAIAAAKLGFTHVVGVDIDPLAIDASTRNVKLNDIQGTIDLTEGAISNTQGSFDVITANLMSEILIRIAPDLSERLKPAGVLVASGMISGQEDDVNDAMMRHGLAPARTIRDGRWVSVVYNSAS